MFFLREKPILIPENKKRILIRYEKEVKEFLRQAENSEEY
jgi:hypothetical protein